MLVPRYALNSKIIKIFTVSNFSENILYRTIFVPKNAGCNFQPSIFPAENEFLKLKHIQI